MTPQAPCAHVWAGSEFLRPLLPTFSASARQGGAKRARTGAPPQATASPAAAHHSTQPHPPSASLLPPANPTLSNLAQCPLLLRTWERRNQLPAAALPLSLCYRMLTPPLPPASPRCPSLPPFCPLPVLPPPDRHLHPVRRPIQQLPGRDPLVGGTQRRRRDGRAAAAAGGAGRARQRQRRQVPSAAQVPGRAPLRAGGRLRHLSQPYGTARVRCGAVVWKVVTLAGSGEAGRRNARGRGMRLGGRAVAGGVPMGLRPMLPRSRVSDSCHLTPA